MSKRKPNKALRTIRDRWIERLNSGQKVSFDWDCGGDETMVTTSVDGKELDYKEAQKLVDVMIEVMQLPNAGEWFVKGRGTLITKDGALLVKHKSHCSGASWDHVDIDMTAPDFEPCDFDWEGNVKYIEKDVDETIELITAGG